MPHPFGNDVRLRQRILSFLGEEALPRIVNLTTPLFSSGLGGRPELVASGVILQVAAARLLITASHVATDWPGFAIVASDKLSIVAGHWTTLRTIGSEPGTTADKADISIIRLEPELADRIPRREILQLTDVDWDSPVIGRDPFLLSGYPERRNRGGLRADTFRARAYTLLLHDANEVLYAAVGADPVASAVLPFEPSEVWTIDGQVTAPNLQGISGGGLWRIPINDGPLGNTRLAAIAVEQHPKGRHRHVLATRIRGILRAIHDLHPDLRAALELAYQSSVG